MTRGYFRVRLVESYGVIAGVILTSLVFGLSHTRHLAGDGMLLLFMFLLLINSLMWTYLAQKTGSVIPSMVAHSLTNGVGTAVLFNIWIPFALVSAGVIIFYKPIVITCKQFLQDWQQDRENPASGKEFLLSLLSWL
ncbi:MAG: CPBP family intramembrane metalloprotease [Gammaproteobacteria bacterium]|jgi:membrane protease YdiL (CAAX protease family)|nr:CPBP family intramembrane metalloprotease [Gammaproteobacteria bacterium]|tara:strand:+ start:886 stop:1296 length:411 start_codon:yes stop_codon:yes gene_type:complete